MDAVQPIGPVQLIDSILCGQFILRKVSKIVSIRCQTLKLKSTKFEFRCSRGYAHTPQRNLRRFPARAPAVFKVPTSKEREVKGKGSMGRGKEGRLSPLLVGCYKSTVDKCCYKQLVETTKFVFLDNSPIPNVYRARTIELTLGQLYYRYKLYCRLGLCSGQRHAFQLGLPSKGKVYRPTHFPFGMQTGVFTYRSRVFIRPSLGSRIVL